MSSLGPFKEAKGYDALDKFREDILKTLSNEGIVESEKEFLDLEIKAIVPYYSILMFKPVK